MSEAEDKLIAAIRDLVQEIVREELVQPVEREPKQAYSEDEFCTLVGISPDTAYKMRKDSELKFIQVGRGVLYSKKNIRE